MENELSIEEKTLQVKLIKSERSGYTEAIRRGTKITGEPLDKETINMYEREILRLTDELALILGSFPWP